VYESSSRILFIDTKPGTAQFQKGVLWYKFEWKGALQTGYIIIYVRNMVVMVSLENNFWKAAT